MKRICQKHGRWRDPSHFKLGTLTPLKTSITGHIPPKNGNNSQQCVFIPSPVRVGTLLSEVPGTPFGGSFFEFELKPTGKDSVDP